jgi:hypothetical protein
MLSRIWNYVSNNPLVAGLLVLLIGSGSACLLPMTSATAAPPSPTPASPETLLKAINFALQGKDVARYVWKSRPDCVVVSDATFSGVHTIEVLYLNRVDASRIRVKPYSLRNPAGRIENYVEVELHGEDTIREYTSDEPKTASADTQAIMKALAPPTEWSYTLETNEPDRVVRAWKYIYAHGCRSAHSSF